MDDFPKIEINIFSYLKTLLMPLRTVSKSLVKFREHFDFRHKFIYERVHAKRNRRKYLLMIPLRQHSTSDRACGWLQCSNKLACTQTILHSHKQACSMRTPCIHIIASRESAQFLCSYQSSVSCLSVTSWCYAMFIKLRARACCAFFHSLHDYRMLSRPVSLKQGFNKTSR